MPDTSTDPAKDYISQFYDVDQKGKRYPQTLAEAVIMAKDSDLNVKEVLTNLSNGVPPADMVEFSAVNSGGLITITLQTPGPTIVDGQRICTPKGVMIRRGEDTYPTSVSDGELVADLKVADIEKVIATGKKYTHDDGVLEADKVYYYSAFPYSDHGVYNISLSEANKCWARTKEYVCYGFRIDQSADKTAPTDMLTPIPEADLKYEISNKNYTNARMDFTTGKFNYGSWTGNEFFFPRSCMLGYDGAVAYYLDENDESKRENGEPSDYSNSSFAGNAMVEFGRNGKQIWLAMITTGDITDFYIADTKIDDNFVAPAFKDGSATHFYLPKYFGSNDGTRMRSISGMANKYNTTAQQELDYAAANGTGWTTVTKAQWDLFVILTWLISGTTNSQAAFGEGHTQTGWHSKYEGIEPGSMDKKGMFWGETTGLKGVKVFGVEHPWGNMWRRIAGWVQLKADKSTRIKLAAPYNTTGEGYITITDGSQAIAGYISKMTFDKRGFFYPSACNGSESTGYCDYHWTNADADTYALVGCSWSSRRPGGSVDSSLNGAASLAYFNGGSALSYTP